MLEALRLFHVVFSSRFVKSGARRRSEGGTLLKKSLCLCFYSVSSYFESLVLLCIASISLPVSVFLLLLPPHDLTACVSLSVLTLTAPTCVPLSSLLWKPSSCSNVVAPQLPCVVRISSSTEGLLSLSIICFLSGSLPYFAFGYSALCGHLWLTLDY